MSVLLDVGPVPRGPEYDIVSGNVPNSLYLSLPAEDFLSS